MSNRTLFGRFAHVSALHQPDNDVDDAQYGFAAASVVGSSEHSASKAADASMSAVETSVGA